MRSSHRTPADAPRSAMKLFCRSMVRRAPFWATASASASASSGRRPFVSRLSALRCVFA